MPAKNSAGRALRSRPFCLQQAMLLLRVQLPVQKRRMDDDCPHKSCNPRADLILYFKPRQLERDWKSFSVQAAPLRDTHGFNED